MTTQADLVSFGNYLLADRGESKHLVSNKLVTDAELCGYGLKIKMR